MSPVLPFDIIALIIDIVGEDENTNLLRSLARVSPSFYQISSKYIFATVELYDATHCDHIRSSKKAFVKLLEGRPDVVKYIRKLTYIVECRINDGDHLAHPFKFPPNIFSSQLPHNQCFTSGLEYTRLFPDTSVPSPHASSYH